MKNRTQAILLVMCSLVIATGVIYADLKKGYYAQAELGSIRQAAPVELLSDSNYQVEVYPVPALDLTPGDGHRDLKFYSNPGHSPRYITRHPPLPAATWEAEVNKMNKVFGAGIPQENTQKIILYLRAHYTPENRKQ